MLEIYSFLGKIMDERDVISSLTLHLPGMYQHPGGYSHYGLTGGSGLFEGLAKDYQMAQFREITLPLRGILVVTTL